MLCKDDNHIRAAKLNIKISIIFRVTGERDGVSLCKYSTWYAYDCKVKIWHVHNRALLLLWTRDSISVFSNNILFNLDFLRIHIGVHIKQNLSISLLKLRVLDVTFYNECLYQPSLLTSVHAIFRCSN